ncbi:MAG: 23S rRNA pseudouridine(1911/1915/1917) synthase RluD [Betaproteobacteria bacterium]|nr:23S rRNA pseudouridine(1911/1915/1917) synthase RluD [Betaproteobacteria bacterium]
MSGTEIEDEDYSPADLLPHPGSAGPAGVQTVEFRVPLTHAGLRLDQVLADLLPGHSRSRLAVFVKDGAVTVDGAVAQPKTKVLGGEAIRARLSPREEDQAFVPQDIALPIIFEDDSVLVIDKPAGLVVHPAAGNWRGTLLNGVLFHHPAAARIPRAGIVHRLDKDTSGVLVVAKTEAAQVALVRQLQARSVSRTYVALVRGLVDNEGTVDAPIGRHPHQRTRMAVLKRGDAGGKPAITHYRVIDRYTYHTLVECRLETGRTHQIRVHMQSIGFPLEGDPLYGGTMTGINPEARDIIRAFGRQALHARRLAFEHPASGKPVQFEAPVPADMRAFIDDMAALP